jgi:hypothetical protein
VLNDTGSRTHPDRGGRRLLGEVGSKERAQLRARSKTFTVGGENSGSNVRPQRRDAATGR